MSSTMWTKTSRLCYCRVYYKKSEILSIPEQKLQVLLSPILMVHNHSLQGITLWIIGYGIHDCLYCVSLIVLKDTL